MILTFLRRSLLIIFLVGINLLFQGLKAQSSLPASPGDTIAPVPVPQAFVEKAVQFRTLKPEAALGDYIRVKVTNLQVLLQNQEQHRRPLVLYFNDIPMHGINAEFISVKDGTILFKLTRDTLSMKAWNVFYQARAFSSPLKVSVSVGFENDTSLQTQVTEFKLWLVRPYMLLFALIGIIAVLGLFIVLARKTPIVRVDSSIQNKGYYSLAKTQLAFWTFIVLTSFIYIWIVTGEAAPVTGSALVLLAISTATTAGAGIIESSKNDTPVVSNAVSDGFFKDILSDYRGVSIHRFQMVLWTMVFGAIFIYNVINNLAMPHFDESLLILTGISSSTYLGLKIPEKEAGEVLPPVTTPEPDIPSYGNVREEEDTEVPPVG